MPHYFVYDLVLSMPFPCPPLRPAPAGRTPDVQVSAGAVPFHLPDPAAEGPAWQAAPGRFLWRGGPRVGRFLVEDGRRVTFQRAPNGEDERIAFHFAASVMAAVLRQRGLLVLHANAALTPEGAVVVAGVSGAGKSTTLAALLARGCRMLSDDVTALRRTPDGQVEVLPGVPQLHLTEEAAGELGTDLAGLPRFPWRRMKAAVPAHTALATGPATLRSLYILQLGTRLQTLPLTGFDKFDALQECIYGPLLPEEHPDLLPLFTTLSEQTTAYRIERPAEPWTAHDVAAAMLATG